MLHSEVGQHEPNTRNREVNLLLKGVKKNSFLKFRFCVFYAQTISDLKNSCLYPHNYGGIMGVGTRIFKI